MQTWTSLFIASLLLLFNSPIQAQINFSEDRLDFSIGIQSNFSQATGPALRYLEERTLNEDLSEEDIIGYRNRLKMGGGIDIGARYKLDHNLFLGLRTSLTQMRMMPSQHTVSRIGAIDETQRELNLTHQLIYFSPKIEFGKAWKGLSWSGGFALNALVGGRTFHEQSFYPPLDDLISYRTGNQINSDRDALYLDPSAPGLYVEVDDASSFGFVPLTYSAFTQFRIQPFKRSRGPYFELGINSPSTITSEVSPPSGTPSIPTKFFRKKSSTSAPAGILSVLAQVG